MDIEKILRDHVDENGNIPTAAINAIVTSVKQAVGKEFVEKSRYNDKLTEIEDYKEKLRTAEDSKTAADRAKVKYDALKAEFAEYKAEAENRAAYDEKSALFRQILKSAGVPEKYHDRIVEVSGNIINGIEKDGENIKDCDSLVNAAKEHWSDFIPTATVVGTQTATPVINNTSSYSSKDEIMSIADPEERQAQIAAHLDLFTSQ